MKNTLLVVDATDLLVGRLGTYVAKQALLGHHVKVVNSEKAVTSGKKENIFSEYVGKYNRGTPRKGPFLHRMPDKLLRRIIRGMVPHDKSRGREAFARIMCYIGIPEELKNSKLIKLDYANKSKLPTLKYVDLGTLSKRIGAKLE